MSGRLFTASAALALSALCALVASANACSKFGEDTSATDAGAGAATEGGANVEGGARTDGGADSGGATCVPLSSATNGFLAVGDKNDGSLSSDATGLQVTYKVDSKGGPHWSRAFDVPIGAKQAILSIEGTVAFAPPVFPITDWFADIGWIAHGPTADDDSTSAVYIVLSNDDVANAGVDLAPFPEGTKAKNPTNAKPFGTFPFGTTQFTATLDINWSGPYGVHVNGDLAGQPTQSTDAADPSGTGRVAASQWTVALGGDANMPPGTTIHYTRVCLDAH